MLLKSTKETSRGRDRKSAGGDSKLENTNLVPQANKDDGGQAHTSKAINKTRFSPFGSRGSSSITSKTKPDGLRLIREKMKTLGVSRTSFKILMNSWREKTRKQYDINLKRYEKFCTEKSLDPFSTSEHMMLDFLTDMFQKGYAYSSVNTARAAVSTINNTGAHPLVCRFMRGVFNLRPSCPRYSHIWYVSIVLRYLRSLSPAVELNLLMLSAQLITLCALVTGQRCQTFHVMDIKHMHISDGRAIFHIEPLLKANSPKNPLTVVILGAYRQDRRICVYTCLKQYLKRTKLLRSSSQLFVTTQSPHNGVSKDTLARWIRLILTKSGVNTRIFKAHSTRATASSVAARGMDISHVLFKPLAGLMKIRLQSSIIELLNVVGVVLDLLPLC
ncbi:tyrosine recombinase [Plakobranchus ocellatus]|uniref:Tyrosine recombinase n=1 Tax=Plakobranchus ocellatus TaxID=259542 RepID=A0AAV3Y228_9GAST|nr:tyrosine recombinase [Plakobranchus ocellatus]